MRLCELLGVEGEVEREWGRAWPRARPRGAAHAGEGVFVAIERPSPLGWRLRLLVTMTDLRCRRRVTRAGRGVVGGCIAIVATAGR